MGVSLEQAKNNFRDAVAQLFAADPSVRSVGITRHGTNYGYRAVKNSQAIMPLSLAAPSIGNI